MILPMRLTPDLRQLFAYAGKTVAFDHSPPDGIDHLKPELNYYQLIYFNIKRKTGEMWSICPAFVSYLFLIKLKPPFR
jgi:hypothetical protein